ncbi:MAG: ABC transporter permease [Candidatus Aenigmarchaeota archaeon]|nr:ABC transporter permease [Candidatus Aenigmarchaeota archaeon]
MKQIANLFKKDVILGIKDIFILLEVGFAIFFVLALIFIIPEDIRTEGKAYIYDSTNIIKDFIFENNPNIEKERGEYFVDNREKVVEGMKKDTSAIGLIITENKDGIFNVDMLIQPYTKRALVKYVEIDIEDLLSILKPPNGVYPLDVYNSLRVTSLKEGMRDIIPFNKRILPAILLLMVGILGLFAMVSLLTQERTEATIRVFRITPADMWSFIISKSLMVLGTGIITFSIIYIPMMGFSGYFESLLIMVLTIIIGSSIGTILAAFFDNIMGSMLWVMLIMIVLSLPAISLFVPIFSPDWLKLIPSYHTLFALDASMFPDGNSHLIWQGAGILASIGVGLFILSGLIFNKLIGREV